MNRPTILAALVMCIALPAYSFTNLSPTVPLISATSTEAVMEAAVEAKPRVSYSAFIAAQKPQYTVGAIVGRFIEEMDGGVRPLGDTHRITLRKIQKLSIASKDAAKLNNNDIIEWAQELVKTVQPCTVDHYLVTLGGPLRYAGSNPQWKCPEINDACIKAARPFLKTNGIVAKSTPRSRRPTDEEKTVIDGHFEMQNNHPNCKTDMARMSRWQRRSAMRIGNSCSILWRDWEPFKQTILVRKMKDPFKRNKHKLVALTWDAQEMLYELAHEMNARPELRDDEKRIHPFNSKTCSQRYTKAKKRLQQSAHPALFVDLHFHDDRRDRGTKLVEVDGYSKEEAIAFTGHENTHVYEHNYLDLDVSLVATRGPASKRLETRKESP